MKKFIVFVLILVVTVSLGVTTFYFLRDNEELVVNTNGYVYLNKGDTLEIDAELKNAKVGNELVITALTEGVLEWNPALNSFTAEEGGATVVEVRTKTNNKINPVYIEVSVGNGMKEAPYYIDSEEDLLNIGSDADGNIFTSSDNYILMQDITLTSPITPILNNGEFTGSLNGNGYSINDLKIETTEGVENAGLFAKIASTGVITGLTLKNVTINGQFKTAGSFAGINEGTITRSQVVSGSVTSTLADASTGAICGLNKYSVASYGRIDRCYSNISVSGTTYVGGLTGTNSGAIVINSYVKLDGENKITSISNGSNVGGLIGLNTNDGDIASSVKNCYSLGEVALAEGVNAEECNLASLIGFNKEISEYKSNYIMGLYTNSSLVGANHQYSLPGTPTETEKLNFRGVNTSFPLDEAQKIDRNNLKSFMSKNITEDATNVVMWDFENVWLLDDTNDGYPYLNKNGANVPDDISVAYDPKVITNETEFINFMNAVNSPDGKPQTYYTLAADLDLSNSTAFMPIGTSTRPFNGTFDGNGHTIKNVKLSSSSINAITDSKYVGLFGRINSASVIKNLVVENITIEDGAVYAGSIVGYNEGTILNCKVTQSSLNKEVVNIKASYAVGGIAGANFGHINKCKVINQTIVSTSTQGNSSTCGGIVGSNGLEANSNKATVENCGVVTCYIYDSKDLTAYPKNYKFRLLKEFGFKYNYVGGIAGSNAYLITSNYVYKTDIMMNQYNVNGTAAGVVAYSKSLDLINQSLAEVSYNKVLGGTITGHYSCGLISNLYGISEYNHVEVDNIHGLISIGLVGRLSLSGGVTGARLNNCFSKSYLTLTDKKLGGTAGMVGDAEYKNEKSEAGYTKFGQIFSACSFDTGLKYAYYDALVSYRNETNFLWNNRTYGIGNNLIWEETTGAKYDNTIFYFDTKQTNLKWFSHEECTLMTNGELVKQTFTSFAFNTSMWTFEEGVNSYPTITGLPEIEEAE